MSQKGSGYNVFDSYRYNYHMDRGTVTVEKTGNGNYQIKTNDFSAICSQNAQRVFVNLNWTGKL